MGTTPAVPAPRWATLTALRRLIPYARPHRAALLGATAAALTGTLAGLIVPLVTRAVVDGPIAAGELDRLPGLVLAVLALGLVEAALIVTRRLLVARPTTRIEARMRADLFAHLQRLPVAFHDGWPSGQLLSRATSDLSTIRFFLAFSGVFLVVNTATVMAGIAVLAWLSPWLGLVAAAVAVPVTLLTLGLERRYAAAARRAQDQAGDLATTVEESAQGIRVLTALGAGPRLAARYLGQARGLRGTELVKLRLLAALWLVLLLLPEAAVAGVLAVGAAGVAGEALSLGTLVAAVTIMAYLAWPVAALGWLLAEAGNAAAACTRYFEVRDVAPAVTDPDRPRPLPRRTPTPTTPPPPARDIPTPAAPPPPAPACDIPTPAAPPPPAPARVPGEVEFRAVRFRYPGADREVLAGVDLTLRPGETLALVGATGCGKTTLASLVGRLQDPTAGAVTLDGIDVRDLRLADLRRVVATAFEEAVLISASVRENVALGSPELADGSRDDAVWEALRVASADGFVAALPFGLDTRIGEQGLSLSGGQRQRLALARAVLGRPSVLVLDDPLSALDVHTEAEVEAALRRVLGGDRACEVTHRHSTICRGDVAGGRRGHGLTALVVAHRPSTVQLADRVALLDGGRIAAVGAHSELLATVPAYRALLSDEPERLGVAP